MPFIDDKTALYRFYKKHLCKARGTGISLDVSRMAFPATLWTDMSAEMRGAYEAMDRLEAGAIANPDEDRMVGHYWLRAPHLAPEQALSDAIQTTINDVIAFAEAVHQKELVPATYGRFTDVLVIGIGGSALGPQLVADALAGRRNKLNPHFLDNTDPDGIERVLMGLKSKLKSTLAVVISKSGGTPETRNGMLLAKAAYEAQGLDFAPHAVAITGEGSKLDQVAVKEGWLKRFPMWDWVGGRTSLMSAVGLVPMALQGINIRQFLEGAAAMDGVTRVHDTAKNPAARLALMWHFATGGKGERQMVMLPYKDRLVLMSKYLQQLVMESLGKAETLDGEPTKQGITVLGNKGSTDQHAYVQQLRDGLDDFFATFILVMQDYATPGKRESLEVEPGITAGDYLRGFYMGTRTALYESGRPSMTIVMDKLDAKSVGALIALYERAVGFYATLVNINAYHQPGVEAGKKAAGVVLDLQKAAVDHLKRSGGEGMSVEALAEAIGQPDAIEDLSLILDHLAANKRQVKRVRTSTYAALT
ncbi:glucose-6-phosphate isomerase [Mucisphaera sp.]|uniref:glucose-6-phosphate isomerase n=1 Tax=Mucisphaera sp. TaxID=2913024 RepID=UPI003D117B96